MNLPEKVELRKTQTQRGRAGGSWSSFPLTIDSTTATSSLSPRLQCDVIPTQRAHLKCRTAACRTAEVGAEFWKRGRLHFSIGLTSTLVFRPKLLARAYARSCSGFMLSAGFRNVGSGWLLSANPLPQLREVTRVWPIILLNLDVIATFLICQKKITHSKPARVFINWSSQITVDTRY